MSERGTTEGQTPGRITGRVRGLNGRARTCLPARAAGAGTDGWRYPEGDSAIVRGED